MSVIVLGPGEIGPSPTFRPGNGTSRPGDVSLPYIADGPIDHLQPSPMKKRLLEAIGSGKKERPRSVERKGSKKGVESEDPKEVEKITRARSLLSLLLVPPRTDEWILTGTRGCLFYTPGRTRSTGQFCLMKGLEKRFRGRVEELERG